MAAATWCERVRTLKFDDITDTARLLGQMCDRIGVRSVIRGQQAKRVERAGKMVEGGSKVWWAKLWAEPRSRVRGTGFQNIIPDSARTLS